MDGQLVRPDDEGVRSALTEFVRVRVTAASDADLARFQFDRHLTLAALFMNADGTVYGRFGTRASRDGTRHVSIAGFENAMRRSLDLHRVYPDNRDSLAAKAGERPSWGTQELLPVKPRKSHLDCVHCHCVGEAEVLSRRRVGEAVRDRDLWPYPVPDLLGFGLDADEQTRVRSIAAESAAAAAGLRVGDEILRADGQPIVSIADVQWVLHNASELVELRVSRGDEEVALELRLTPGWRRRADAAWRASWNLEGWVAGFTTEPLPSPARKRLGIAEDALALRLTHTQLENQYLRFGNAAARELFRKDDVLVGVDGASRAMTTRELLAYLLQETEPGESVRLELLRGGSRIEVELPIE